jgi:hypothetical protein
MPFITSSEWAGDASRVWLWVVLTVPATVLAYAFYVYWKSRDSRTRKKDSGPEEGVEMN